MQRNMWPLSWFVMFMAFLVAIAGLGYYKVQLLTHKCPAPTTEYVRCSPPPPSGAGASSQDEPNGAAGMSRLAPAPTDGRRRLFDAIRQVESGGNDQAVGDNGRSLGAYQIGMAYWTDACEYGKVQWDYPSLVWSRPHAEKVMRWYWQRYGATTDEQRARMHNGGPRGPARHSTAGYWNKVTAAMR